MRAAPAFRFAQKPSPRPQNTLQATVAAETVGIIVESFR